MKSKIITVIASIMPFMGFAANLDTSLHIQLDPRYAEQASHMKLSGKIYDYSEDKQHMWIVHPKVYFSPSRPMAFGLSAGHRHKLGDLEIGHHVFSHFHNFNNEDYIVQQFGHTLEMAYGRFFGNVNYHYPAKLSDISLDKVKGSHKLEGEAGMRIYNTCLSAGPMFDFKDNQWGFKSKACISHNDKDYGIEVKKTPGYEVMAAMFVTFHFPSKEKKEIKATSDSASFYTPVIIERPVEIQVSGSFKEKNDLVGDNKENTNEKKEIQNSESVQ